MQSTGHRRSSKKILEKYWMRVLLENHEIKNKGTFEFVVINGPNWVMSIPTLGNERYLLVRQYRPAWNSMSVEFPAGRLDEGENFEDAVQRELLEETGYIAQKHQLLQTSRPVSWTDQTMKIYLSTDLLYEGQRLDEQESIEVVEASISDIGEFIKKGQMIQSSSILAYHLLLGHNQNSG